MDLPKMKAAIDIDAAKAFRGQNSLQLDGTIQFLRQEIVDAQWAITRAQKQIEAYQAVIDKIEESRHTCC